uniref:Uncharacterized protein n=1 Tax=Rousettus aegyptiacus TaxID=9407 RepID=A0A7J8KBB0_ROUAE|nr:hypothetical protein HJG63_007942 [Rousettus aegyptiacus]
MRACLCACCTNSPFHLAVRKGDSRLELEPTGASLLGNASSSPPGSCLAWRGPSWQAEQPRSPGGQGEGMVRGKQLPPQARPWELGQWQASLLAGSSPLNLGFPPPCSSVLSIPQRGILETLHHPSPAKEKTCRRGAAIGKARNTY